MTVHLKVALVTPGIASAVMRAPGPMSGFFRRPYDKTKSTPCDTGQGYRRDGKCGMDATLLQALQAEDGS